MATLDVFEMTNSELNKCFKTKSSVTEGVKKSTKKTKRMRKENFSRFHSIKQIPCNMIRLEAIGSVVEDEDEATDYTPSDDVMVVVDPEMSEVPTSADEIEAQAEQHIGDHVCQCSICGSMYITSEDVVDEDVEDDVEQTCPVCGEQGEQIVIGELTSAETDIDDEEDVEDAEDDDLATDDDFDVDDFDVDDEDTSIEDEDDIDDETEDDEDENSNESFNRSSRSRRFGEKRLSKSKSSKMVECNFDEVVFNRMLTNFAKENYNNVRAVRITKAKCVNQKLTLEGIVTTTKGNRRNIKFVCEQFNPTSRMSLKFKEFGPFTESYNNKAGAFTLECTMNTKNVIQPKALRYDYKVKEGRQMYSVSGKVLKESINKSSNNRYRRRSK